MQFLLTGMGNSVVLKSVLQGATVFPEGQKDEEYVEALHELLDLGTT